jgi:hypothetical protein
LTERRSLSEEWRPDKLIGSLQEFDMGGDR